jgi:phospholipase D1/2
MPDIPRDERLPLPAGPIVFASAPSASRPRMSPDRKRLARVAVIAAILVAAVTAAWHFTPLKEWITADRVVDWVETFSRYWWAPYALVLLYTPASVVLFPRALLTVAAAAVFGPWEGFFIAMSGVVVNTLAGYGAGRLLDPQVVKRWGGSKMERIGKALGKEGFVAVATLGLVPIAPFIVELLAFGALRLPVWQVLAGTVLANLPGTVGSTLMGDQLNAILSHDRHVNRGVIVFVVLLVAGMAYATRRLWKKMQPLLA